LRQIAAELERAGHPNERGVRYSAASVQHMLAQRVVRMAPAAREAYRAAA
jgi:hypothetical protein